MLVFERRNCFKEAFGASTASLPMTVSFLFGNATAIAAYPMLHANASFRNLAAALHHRIVLRRRVLVEIFDKQFN